MALKGNTPAETAGIEHYLPTFLKLHKALKNRGLNPNNVEWFADAIETGDIKTP
jgi:hypothetical protein